jgi:hypothetical protein
MHQEDFDDEENQNIARKFRVIAREDPPADDDPAD